MWTVMLVGVDVGIGYAQETMRQLPVDSQLKFVGRATCSAATCHGGPIQANRSGDDQDGVAAMWHVSSTIWEADDPHARAGARLLTPQSRMIVNNLQPTSVESDALFHRTLVQRCVACHAPEAMGSITQSNVPPALQLPVTNNDATRPGKDPQWLRQVASGVGCESCHGPAERWLVEHTQRDWKPRSETAQMLGLRDTQTITSRVKDCAGCHIGSRIPGSVVRDVNHDLLAAGHPRMQFDPLVMEARLPPHWQTQPGAPMHVPMTEVASRFAARQMLARDVVLTVFRELVAQRRASIEKLPQPEFSELNCQTCHRTLEGGTQ